MSEEWCREQLAKLQIKDRRLSTLTEIRDHLSTLPANELAVTTNYLSVPEIFQCVEESPEPNANEQTNLACDILSICMANLELNQNENKHYLEKYLQHPIPDVKLVGLNEIKKSLAHRSPPETAASNLIDPNIQMAMIQCLQSSSTKVGTICVQILTQTLDKYLDDTGIRANLEKCLNRSDVAKCRVYEICVNLAKKSIETMEKVDFVLQHLATDLDNKDVLMQFNSLEFLSDLALVSHGLVYLENSGVFGKITKNIETLADNPMKDIIVPGYMKFFGNVSSMQPAKIIQGFPIMINALFDCILDSDCSILPVAFDTLGQLAQSDEGKILLHANYTAKLRETLNEIGKSIHNLTTRLQTRALNCLEIMFKYNGEPNNQVSSITKAWFTWLTGTNGLAFLMDFCRNPFPEIKIAALTLLRAICTNRWGQQALDETAGFIEFLLDRRTEFDKDAIQEKYSVIKVLAESSVFSPSMQMQLRKYVNDGAFYVESVMEVAIDGS